MLPHFFFSWGVYLSFLESWLYRCKDQFDLVIYNYKQKTKTCRFSNGFWSKWPFLTHIFLFPSLNFSHVMSQQKHTNRPLQVLYILSKGLVALNSHLSWDELLSRMDLSYSWWTCLLRFRSWVGVALFSGIKHYNMFYLYTMHIYIRLH